MNFYVRLLKRKYIVNRKYIESSEKEFMVGTTQDKHYYHFSVLFTSLLACLNWLKQKKLPSHKKTWLIFWNHSGTNSLWHIFQTKIIMIKERMSILQWKGFESLSMIRKSCLHDTVARERISIFWQPPHF